MDTSLHERTLGIEGQGNIFPRAGMSSSNSPRHRAIRYGSEMPNAGPPPINTEPVLSCDPISRHRNPLGAHGREQNPKPETWGFLGTTGRGPREGRLQLWASQNKQRTNENRQQLIRAGPRARAAHGLHEVVFTSVIVNTGTVIFL